jgi:xanthine dehydrogenase iron-sulfur cluster and FAD-binding subunit A
MAGALEFTLNGRAICVTDCSPNTTLLEFLRGSGLTGSKEGCAEGDCGACSVAIVERDANGKTTYRSINSCLVPVCLMARREVVTVEGVGCSANMHPVQRAMAEGFGSQCGYCTPGFICSMFEGYYRDDLRTNDDLDDQLSGNLCRCTGYRPIRDAAIEAFAERHAKNGEDAFAERLKKDAGHLTGAEYEFAKEKFFRPTSLAELLRLLKENSDARLIAGATELGLDITKRYKKFPTLVSVEAVLELNEIHRRRMAHRRSGHAHGD